jgi:hypothetical protein
MSLTSRWNWLAVIVAVVSMMAVGVALPGCAQKTAPVEEEADADADDVDADSDTDTPDDADTDAPEADEPPPLSEEPDISGPELGGPEVGEIDVVETDTAAAPAADGKISSYAPAADLEGQVVYYIERVGKSLKDPEDYEDKQDRIARDANTLAVLALALGLHDEDNKYKVAAPALLKAAQDLSKTKDHAAAKAAAVVLVAAAEGKDPVEAELKWEKVVPLAEIKEQMSGINSSLKRHAKRGKFEDCAGYSALIAVVGQAILSNDEALTKPDDLDQWTKYCLDLRNTAAAVNAAMHAEDKEAAAAAMEKMEKSCETCHEVFNKEEDEE